MGEIALSLFPIIAIFFLFQIFSLKMTKLGLARICFGLLYTYLGLVLFLTGVNIGFSSLGAVLGEELATGWTRIIMIPLSMLLGWFIISTEPAVAVLENQIEEVSAGAIPGKAIKLSLSIAIAIAMGISMLRVLTGIPILWFLIPGYAIALILSFFVPDIYTAIAFDSGGVASRSHDRHLHASVRHRSQHGSGRQRPSGRFRSSGHGSHDASDFHPNCRIHI